MQTREQMAKTVRQWKSGTLRPKKGPRAKKPTLSAARKRG